jgi:hypothetical protein
LIADMSVAPEIARLAEAVVLVPAQPATPAGQAPAGQAPAGQAPAGQAPAGQARTGQAPTGQAPSPTQEQAAAPLTVGTLARSLRSIAATPERWWGLVRFEPDRPVQITVEEGAAYRAWLVVMPPGDAGQSCDCDVATMIAGEATDGAPASAVLRPGPMRVHARRHSLRGQGAGYSISLHAQAHRSSKQG